RVDLSGMLDARAQCLSLRLNNRSVIKFLKTRYRFSECRNSLMRSQNCSVFSMELEVLVDLVFPVPPGGPHGECEEEPQAESEQRDDHQEAQGPWELGRCPVAFVERHVGQF